MSPFLFSGYPHQPHSYRLLSRGARRVAIKDAEVRLHFTSPHSPPPYLPLSRTYYSISEITHRPDLRRPFNFIAVTLVKHQSFPVFDPPNHSRCLFA